MASKGLALCRLVTHSSADKIVYACPSSGSFKGGVLKTLSSLCFYRHENALRFGKLFLQCFSQFSPSMGWNQIGPLQDIGTAKRGMYVWG